MVYTPQRGFAQSQYFDQQATALAGMLANASDINLVDSAFVGGVDPAEGLTAGIGVKVIPTTASNRPGLNYDIVVPPSVDAVDDSFAGIVVRNQFMRTNTKGQACYNFEDMANYARRDRAGARIWVQLEKGTATFGSDVYWIVRDTASHGLKIGAFSAEAINGAATPTPAVLTGGTMAINDVKAVRNGGFDITIGGVPYKPSAMDFSSAATVSDVASVVDKALTAVLAPATVKVAGNGIAVISTTTGVGATITYASAPAAKGSPVDASTVLALTAAAGATMVKGSAGFAEDTVRLSRARFLGTFTAGEAPCNNIALVELL